MAGSAGSILRKRDFRAGALVILIGMVAVVNGPRYGLGALTRMGPGFMPTVLGAILVLLGLVIAASALAARHSYAGTETAAQWRGWGCIIVGPLCFILLGTYGGLIPATFSCVFVCALGDEEATLKGSFVLAAIVTAFGVALFSYVLKVPMPLLAWSAS